MERRPVSSSTIGSIGYDPNSQVLEVEFKNGNVYQYFDVPEQVFDEFCIAPSPGRYLSEELKPRYRYSRT